MRGKFLHALEQSAGDVVGAAGAIGIHPKTVLSGWHRRNWRWCSHSSMQA